MIDFVVTWLDSSDEKWQQQYNYYKEKCIGHQEAARFRNMDIFRYWFRAVEQYAPWVNKVFLVTNGTFPKWINENNLKLVLVKHSDYIPEELLPTFNSRTIELFMHKIPGLSEQFVYFNDEMYLNAPVLPETFFRKGLPCDDNTESMMNVPTYHERNGYAHFMSILADIGVINAHFDRRQTVRQSLKRWYGLHLGKKGLLLSFLLRHSKRFIGFNRCHFEQPYLKSVFADAWNKAPKVLFESCSRFRKDVSLNPYFFRYWQFATNRFYPVKLRKAELIIVCSSTLKKVEKVLNDPEILSVCLNDTPYCMDEEFGFVDRELRRMLEQKFPMKSSFEK